jgi:hypothetical protein
MKLCNVPFDKANVCLLKGKQMCGDYIGLTEVNRENSPFHFCGLANSLAKSVTSRAMKGRCG